MDKYIEFLLSNTNLVESPEYANFLMNNCDRPICNGDMLTELMEEGYMFKEFIIERNA